MHQAVKITETAYWLGVNDRKTALFENLWPLPNGVAYNSYVLIDEKVALIDTVEVSKAEQFIANIKQLLNGRKVDYLIMNHIEPDHSGAIHEVIRNYPDVKIVGNKMTFSLLDSFYGIIPNKFEVKNNDILDLGTKKLQFLITPWVHWPETMMTYETTEKILFSGDAFGSFGTLDGGIFDDEVNLQYYTDEMLRYYSNIVGKYSKMANKAAITVKALDLSHICSTHGLIWRSNINYVVNLYEKWSSYKADQGVVIVFGSMYGNTELLADAIARRLAERGIKNIRIYDASKTHISFILSEIWKYRGVMLGSSAYNSSIFPSMEMVISKLVQVELKNRVLGIFGSSSWNKAGVKVLKTFAQESEWDFIPESIIEAKGAPSKIDMEMCIQLADAMYDKLAEKTKV
ncbi:MAG TPA: FprA family A-type flavoprotein [Bacteroidales bacterium]|nr:FprA family A-type flavoprotein [Bacteroidales bacterium]